MAKITQVNPAEDWKSFVRMLCKMNVSNSSQEIADVINRNSSNKITWQAVAGVKSAITKGL
jgi:hypothetical protein